MMAVQGTSRADVAWLCECRRRLRHLLGLRLASWTTPEERWLMRYGIYSVRRDFERLGLLHEADYLIRSSDLAEDLRQP